MKRTFTCALVLTAVVGASSSAAAVPVWTVQKKTGDAWLNVVEVVGKGNTWFFGDELIIDDSPESRRPVVAYHWNGRKITKVPLPKETRWGSVYDADFASADDGWAVGTGWGLEVFVLRWNGRTWKLIRNVRVDGAAPEIKALGGGRALVTGVFKGDVEMQWTFDGKTWRTGRNTLDLYGYSKQYALGWKSDKPALHRWTGRRWVKHPLGALPKTTRPDQLSLHSLQVVSPKKIWVIAEVDTGEETAATYLLRWNGRTWKRERVRLPSAHAGLHYIAPDGRGGVWATGGTGTHYESEDAPSTPLLYHRLPDGTWRKHRTDTVVDAMAHVPGTTTLWAAARHGYWRDHTILTHDKPR